MTPTGKRIGVFGGTFDPIHTAHLAMARATRDAAKLDTVLFVVAARPPHKNDEAATSEQRYAMVAAAVADEPGFEASRIELDRPGLSYTADTLRELRRMRPHDALFLILGMDSLVDLPNWREPEAILELAHILVIPRPGRHSVPPSLDGRYTLVPFHETMISSTEVRRRLACCGDDAVRALVPAAALQIIRKEGLYENGS